jgi:RNA 2',3'-cyclic 3'-phosphodiesterase
MPGAKADSLRAFVALDLDAVSVRRVARVADRLRMGSGAPSATWTPAPKMHATVKFLGNVARGAIERLVADKKAPRPGTFHLDAFPSVEAARVVVALLEDPHGDLAKLAGRLDKLGVKFGVAPEKKEFRPHVTLARLKMPFDVRRWLRPELAPGTDACAVARLTLFESHIDDHGSTYTPLATFAYAPPT